MSWCNNCDPVSFMSPRKALSDEPLKQHLSVVRLAFCQAAECDATPFFTDTTVPNTLVPATAAKLHWPPTSDGAETVAKQLEVTTLPSACPLVRPSQRFLQPTVAHP